MYLVDEEGGSSSSFLVDREVFVVGSIVTHWRLDGDYIVKYTDMATVGVQKVVE